MKYRVHLYCVVRVPMDVEADGQIAAIQKAEELFHRDANHNIHAHDAEYAEEINTALVDEVGDAEFERSRTYPRREWEV